MKFVTFTDRSIDTRSLGGDDLAKAGVEGFEDMDFHKGQRVEVTNKVAAALEGNPHLFGTFTVEDEGNVSDEDKADAKAAAKAEADNPPTGSDQESVSPPKVKTTQSSTP